VFTPRKTRHTHAKLDDPIIVVLRTKGGVHIDGEVFVNCRYGYDIQCQVVGEEGIANLPEPESVLLRREGRLSTAIGQDWKMRFIDSYDVELQDWIKAATTGKISGPSAWDGYFAAVTADACLEAKRTGETASIVTPPRPAFYD
jgi:myo-inositol 2-dehydrogenase/D-chiro-inositol 1-dehydrogenase